MVFPAPLGPTIPKMLPAATVRVMSSTACLSSKLLLSLVSARTIGATGFAAAACVGAASGADGLVGGVAAGLVVRADAVRAAAVRADVAREAGADAGAAESRAVDAPPVAGLPVVGFDPSAGVTVDCDAGVCRVDGLRAAGLRAVDVEAGDLGAGDWEAVGLGAAVVPPSSSFAAAWRAVGFRAAGCRAGVFGAAGLRAAGLRGWADFPVAPVASSPAFEGDDSFPEVGESARTGCAFCVSLPGSGSTAQPYQAPAQPWLKGPLPSQIGHKNL